MRLIRTLAVAFLTLAPVSAMAQGVCPVGQAQPTIVATGSQSITANNECALFIFTNPTGTVVSIPALSSMPPHMQWTMLSTGGPISMTVTGSPAFNGNAVASGNMPQFAQYVPVTIFADGNVNLYGVPMSPSVLPGQYTNFPSTTALMPGTTLDGSTVWKLGGSGILQVQNQASWQKGYNPPWLGSTVCAGAPYGGQQPGSPWMTIFDAFGIKRYIPTC